MVGRWCENKAVLPTIEQGVLWQTLGRHLVAPAHDVKGHNWPELPREVVTRVFESGRLVRQDTYLAKDIFWLERAVGSS